MLERILQNTKIQQKKNIETIGKLTLEEDELGILRLYVSGEMQDDLSKASDYKEVITRTWSYVTWFKQEKSKSRYLIFKKSMQRLRNNLA